MEPPQQQRLPALAAPWWPLPACAAARCQPISGHNTKRARPLTPPIATAALLSPAPPRPPRPRLQLPRRRPHHRAAGGRERGAPRRAPLLQPTRALQDAALHAAAVGACALRHRQRRVPVRPAGRRGAGGRGAGGGRAGAGRRGRRGCRSITARAVLPAAAHHRELYTHTPHSPHSAPRLPASQGVELPRVCAGRQDRRALLRHLGHHALLDPGAPHQDAAPRLIP